MRHFHEYICPTVLNIGLLASAGQPTITHYEHFVLSGEKKKKKITDGWTDLQTVGCTDRYNDAYITPKLCITVSKIFKRITSPSKSFSFYKKKKKLLYHTFLSLHNPDNIARKGHIFSFSHHVF